MQSDGNIVFYVKADSSGLVKDSWAPGTYTVFQQTLAVPPNIQVVECPCPIMPVADAGNIAVINSSDELICATSGTNVLPIQPNGGEITGEISQTGIVYVNTYELADLRAPDRTRLRKRSSSDATVRSTAHRQTITINNDGSLTLRGRFIDSPEESMRDLAITGSRPSEDTAAEKSQNRD